MDDSSSDISAPSAQGTFAKTPLPHVLVHALNQELTGTFELSLNGAPAGTFLVIDGQPGKARTMVDHYLLPVLQQIGILTAAQVHNWLPRLMTSLELHGKALVRHKVLTEAQVNLGLREQLVQQMQTIVALPPDTTWRYYDGVDTLAGWGEDTDIRLDPYPFVWSSLRREPPWEHVGAALAQTEGSAIRLQMGVATERFQFDKSEGKIVELLERKARRFSDLVTGAGTSAQTAQLVVYCLMLVKAVDFVAASEAAFPSEPPPVEAPPVSVEIEAPSLSSTELGRHAWSVAPVDPRAEPESTDRVTFVPDETVASVRPEAPASLGPAPSAGLRATPTGEEAAPPPSRRNTPRGIGPVKVAAPEAPESAPPATPRGVGPAKAAPPAPPAPQAPQAPQAPSRRKKDPVTLVPFTPPPPPPDSKAPVTKPGLVVDPEARAPITPPPPAPTVRHLPEGPESAAPPTPVASLSVLTPLLELSPASMAALIADAEAAHNPLSIVATPRAPAVAQAAAAESKSIEEFQRPTKPPPPDLEEPGYDVPLIPPAGPIAAVATALELDDLGDALHTRSTAESMKAVTPEQVTEFLASQQAELPKPDVAPQAASPGAPAPSPAPAPAAAAPSLAAPVPPAPPSIPRPSVRGSPARPVQLPPLGRGAGLPPPPLARGPRGPSPVLFAQRLPGAAPARPAIVPPEPSPPPPATALVSPATKGIIDISEKGPEEGRTSANPPYSTRKTLEVPIDRALIDATMAAASSRATVEIVSPPPSGLPASARPTVEVTSAGNVAAPPVPAPTPQPAAPPAKGPFLGGPSSSRLTRELDSPFDAGWDDADPPAEQK